MDIQEIIEEFKECQRERDYGHISENVTCNRYERIFKRIEQAQTKDSEILLNVAIKSYRVGLRHERWCVSISPDEVKKQLRDLIDKATKDQ